MRRAGRECTWRHGISVTDHTQLVRRMPHYAYRPYAQQYPPPPQKRPAPPAGRFFWRHPPAAAGVACRMDRLPAIRPLHGTQDRGARPSQDALGSRIPGGIPLSARSRARSVMNVTEKRFCVGHYVFDPKHSSTLLPSKRPAPQRAAFLSRVGFVCFATSATRRARTRDRGSRPSRARRSARR